MRSHSLPLLVAAASLLAATSARSTMNITVVDGAGEGFNDPTVVAPVAGNPATTRGAQRLNALQAAANQWDASLNSPVTIEVHASFDEDLPCSSSSATLGVGGPAAGYANPSMPPPGIDPGLIYPIALANKIIGADACPVAGSCMADHDINIRFNSLIDTTCTFPADWYYGLDAMPPGSARDFYSVALHELGHALGFTTLVNPSTGAKPMIIIMGTPTPFDDPYMLHLEDHSTGMLFPVMTDAERAAATKSVHDLHWVGPAVAFASAFLTAGRTAAGHVEMYAPTMVATGSSLAHFNTVLTPNEVMEPSYTGPNHNITLTRALLQDIGWNDCGNGAIDSGEGCDDGDATSGDGCSAICQVEQCYQCAGAPSACSADNGAACDDGDVCTTGDVCTGTVCGGTQSCTLDHFLTYKVKVTSGTPKFAPVGSALGTVDLTSDFATAALDVHDTRGVTVSKPVALGLPADKNGEGILDPGGVNGLHLEEYQVKTITAGSFALAGYAVTVQNQCGTLELTGFKPASLMIPTAKNLTMAVPPPSMPALDHFECYTAKLASTSAKLAKGTQVTITDQFMTNWRLDLKKVKKLCVPVDKQGTPLDKNGAPPAAFTPALRHPSPPPLDSLLCYQAKRATKTIVQNGCGPLTPGDPGTAIVPAPPKHTKVLGMHVNNQLGPLRLDSVKENELCIPSATTCANCP